MPTWTAILSAWKNGGFIAHIAVGPEGSWPYCKPRSLPKDVSYATFTVEGFTDAVAAMPFFEHKAAVCSKCSMQAPFPASLLKRILEVQNADRGPVGQHG